MTTRRNPRTRQAILDALDRLLDVHQLDDIGVSEILAEAGLASRTTYYRHFGGSDEAFIALAEHALEEIGQEVRLTVSDAQIRSTLALRAAVEHWMQRGRRHRGLARSMITEWPRIPGLKDVYLTFLAELTSCLAAAIDQDRAAGHVVTSLPSRSVAMMTLWSVERAIFAAAIGARGFDSSATTADALVAQYLALVYGLAHSQMMR